MAPSVRRNMVTERCVQGTRPPCSCACPMNFNLREFMRLCSIVGTESGYRIMYEELVFPEIAHRLCGGRCMEHCAVSIDIYGLEEACLTLASKKDPAKYSVAKKESSVAIVGAGIAGMVCALRLSVRGFQVTVFERKTEVGGTLSAYMDEAVYREEFERQFLHAPYTFCPETEIKTQDALSGFDAVFLATGARGETFGLIDTLNPRSFATSKKGWFAAGALTGADPFTAMAQARVASTSIEKFLLMSGSMAGDETSFLQTECLYEVKTTSSEGHTPVSEWNKQAVKEEAKRCRQCDCTICYDDCAFMQNAKMFPKELEDNVLGAMSPDGLEEPQGYRLIYSCLACGHCGRVCPEGIDLAPLFMKGKRWLKNNGKFPDQLHAYYLDDMHDAVYQNRLLHLPHGRDKVRYLFFPGCKATGSGSLHVKEAYRYLSETEPSSGLLMGCCGIPAYWAGKEPLFKEILSVFINDWHKAGEPEVVLMCPSCMKTFADFLPDIPFVSLYEIMEANPPKKQPGHPEALIFGADDRAVEKAVFDACSSAGFPAMQKAVREVLKSSCAGRIKFSEIKGAFDQAFCCGSGGHAFTANPDVVDHSISLAAGLSELPYVVYCENCRDVFLSGGKKCSHVLDEVFRLSPAKKASHPGDSRTERRKLYCEISGIPYDRPKNNAPIVIADDLLRKMDRLLVSTEDVLDIILTSESVGDLLLTDEGSFICSSKKGFVTIWTEYTRKNDIIELKNVYSHRVEIHGVV